MQRQPHPLQIRPQRRLFGLSAAAVRGKNPGPNTCALVFVGASRDIDPWYAMLPEFTAELGWIPETILLGTLLGQEVIHVSRGIKEGSPGRKIKTAASTFRLPGKKPQSLEIANDPGFTVPITITAVRVGDDVFSSNVGPEPADLVVKAAQKLIYGL